MNILINFFLEYLLGFFNSCARSSKWLTILQQLLIFRFQIFLVFLLAFFPFFFSFFFSAFTVANHFIASHDTKKDGSKFTWQLIKFDFFYSLGQDHAVFECLLPWIFCSYSLEGRKKCYFFGNFCVCTKRMTPFGFQIIIWEALWLITIQ